LTAEIGAIVKEKGLNILFNNAAISPKSTRLPFVKPEQLLETFTVNTLAPILLTKVFKFTQKKPLRPTVEERSTL
jgi:NAD(P)-dependent dehydrogenase (short-subunit alcohol dehydrogenase family)